MIKVICVKRMAKINVSQSFIVKGIKEELTIKNTRSEKVIELFQIVEPFADTLLVPRSYLQKCKTKVTGKWSKLKGASNIMLAPEQTKIINGYLKSLLVNKYGAIIDAPTGSGKTVMGIKISYLHKLKTLIVVPTDSIMKQWIKQLQTFTNLKREDIGIIKQNICEYKDKQFVIAMVHTLAKEKKYDKELYDYFGHVIFDEVHLIGAETFSRAAPMFNCKVRTGLSATPVRKDGMEKVFLYHIGPIVESNISIPVIPKVIIINYPNPASSHSNCFWGGELSLGKYFNKLAKIDHRNQIIAKHIKMAYDKGHEILVLSDRIIQLKYIEGVLLSNGIPQKDIGLIIHKIKQTEQRIRLGTYGSAGIGLDIPELTCLVFATPRADVVQAAGRLTRKKKNKKQPIIVDIVDTFSSIMVGWWKFRMKLYNKYDTEIKHITEIKEK